MMLGNSAIETSGSLVTRSTSKGREKAAMIWMTRRLAAPSRRPIERTTTWQAQKRRALQRTTPAHEEPEAKRPASILCQQSTSTSHAGKQELYVVDEVHDCDLSVVAAADEIADPSREAMLKEVISPWSSQLNLLETADANGGSDCSNGLVGRVVIGPYTSAIGYNSMLHLRKSSELVG
ncbi:hypothetical protein BDV97DRAFT_224594 [Delphinella strobiligena]|nr:hypothetical protein BDV97DRAFT_224594 [Delphinella strobiligena]